MTTGRTPSMGSHGDLALPALAFDRDALVVSGGLAMLIVWQSGSRHPRRLPPQVLPIGWPTTVGLKRLEVFYVESLLSVVKYAARETHMSDSWPPTPPAFQQPPPQRSSGKAIASMVLGICSLLAWLCPIVGLAVSIIGLVLGVQAKKLQRNGMATAGIVTSVIGLTLSLVNAAVGAYLGVTGQHPLFE